MKEIKDIISSYHAAVKAGKQTALATVVHLQGSAYRRPGARMLVTDDGKLTGAISGGCLEGDALRKAQLVMVQKKPMLVTYDTTDDDDTMLGVGLGCNGIISILIEPINNDDENNPIQILQTFLGKRQAAVVVTLFSLDKKLAQPGTCLLVTDTGSEKKVYADDVLPKTLMSDVMDVLSTRTSLIKTYNTQTGLTAFIEMLETPVSFIIFGAGNDSIPLVKMADILGWETTVIDGRSNYATRERFPLATNIIVSKPDAALSKIQLDARTIAALMTHNYNYDLAILRQLLTSRISYIGALGPKKKLTRMLDDLKEEGMLADETELSTVYGPAGLDIGSETSEEIALSIIAEIKAVLSKRTGSSLREKEQSIHYGETIMVENIIT